MHLHVKSFWKENGKEYQLKVIFKKRFRLDFIKPTTGGNFDLKSLKNYIFLEKFLENSASALSFYYCPSTSKKILEDRMIGFDSTQTKGRAN